MNTANARVAINALKWTLATTVLVFSASAISAKPAVLQPRCHQRELLPFEIQRDKADNDRAFNREEGLDGERFEKMMQLVSPGNPVTVDWNTADRLIRSGHIAFFLQSHSKIVYLVSWNDQAYVTKEKRLDDLLPAIDFIDPCHAFIRTAIE